MFPTKELSFVSCNWYFPLVSYYKLMQRTVWIIDDDMVSQFATRYCLEQFGVDFVISTFSNAEAGLMAITELLE